MKEKYEIRQIDAYMYDDMWTWNTSYLICTWETSAESTRRAFYKKLRDLGIRFKDPKNIIMIYDGDVYEVQDRKTGEPLFAAIPLI